MSEMTDRYFIDTSVFVHSFDPRSAEKKAAATQLIGEALSSRNGVISYQVVQEFLNVTTQKFAVPMKYEDRHRYLEIVLLPLCEVFPSIEFYRTGLDLSNRFGFSFHDSLIVAGALAGKCAVLYSEDLQHGQRIENLTIQNPFSAKGASQFANRSPG